MILDKNPFYEDKEINIYHINDYFIIGFKAFISKKKIKNKANKN